MGVFGRLDRYVGRFALGSYAAALAFMVFLVILLDVLLQMGHYLALAEKRQTGTWEFVGYLARYYVLTTPFLFVTVAPFVTVIASMFAVTRLMGSNEIGPMLFAGRSMWRVLRPVLAIAIGSGLMMAVCWEFVIPSLSDRVQEATAVLQDGDGGYRNLVLRSVAEPDKELFCTRYDHEVEELTGVLLLDRGSTAGDSVLIQARAAVWSPEGSDWVLLDGTISVGTETRPVDRLGVGDLTPERMWQTAKDAKHSAELSYSDLQALRKLKPQRLDYVLQFHRHITAPLANLVLLLLALPFAIHFERGRKLERVVYSIGICGAYLVFDLACQNLGLRGTVHPIVAAWVPPIVFGSLGLVLFGGMRT